MSAPADGDRRVCCRCGCLCDDIGIEERQGKIGRAANACSMGEEWLRSLPPPALAAFGKNLRPLPAGEAISQAAALLRAARAPALWGFTGITLEGQLEAARLAERLRCPLLPFPEAPFGARESGRWAPELSASLDEVRASADTIIFWRAEPELTHPRHLERYSGGGLSSPLRPGLARAIFRVGVRPAGGFGAPAATRPPDCELPADPSFAPDLALILALRRRIGTDPAGAPGANAGEARRHPEGFGRLAEGMLRAGRLHFFLGAEAARSQPLWDALQLLAAMLHDRIACGIGVLPPPGNARGLEETMCWQTGLSGPLDFDGRGAPRQRPELSGGARHADLIFAAGLPDAQLESLRAPRVALSPVPDARAEISFAVPDLDPRVRGRVLRSDGAVLWLCGSPERGVEDPVPALLRGIADRL